MDIEDVHGQDFVSPSIPVLLFDATPYWRETMALTPSYVILNSGFAIKGWTLEIPMLSVPGNETS